MSFDVEKLYSLLPAIYRIRDIEVAGQGEGLLAPAEQAELQTLRALATLTEKEQKRLEQLEEKRQRGPLKALLSIISEQAAVLEENLDQLYDDLFIETCDEWVVPYISDLVGARGVFVFPGAKFTERAFVANTLAYRRRKGTAAVLEQLACDVTGWTASVVEYFQLLATTQYLNHLRLDNLSVADLRNSKTLDWVNTPFDRVTRTADVRRIEPRRGKYNIPNVGIFLYRIDSFSVTDAPAFQLDSRRYLFDALGKDTQLYNKPETEDQITHLAEPINVPMPIGRRTLHRYLDTYYGVDVQGEVKSILLNVDGNDVLPPRNSPTALSPPAPRLSDLIVVCDLSDLKDLGGNIIGWAHKPQDRIAIDPILGRIAFPESKPAPARVQVTHRYGFSAEMGGGEYGRAKTFSEFKSVIKVGKKELITTISDGLNELKTLFNANPEIEGGVVEVVDNHAYELLDINVPAGKKVEIRAADKRRPVLLIAGQALISGGENAELTLNGLVIAGGGLLVSQTIDNELGRLCLRHCTLFPGPSVGEGSPPQIAEPRLVIEERNVAVEIDHCIIGAIRAIDGARLHITDSIIDATDETEVAYAGLSESDPGAAIKTEDTTIIGKVHTQIMELASNTIFLSALKTVDDWISPLIAERLQQGCVRFSYVPPGSRLPRLHRCQPASPGDAARVRPVFTSLRYGDAGYCQLSQHCAVEIRQGADDGAEMGAFHDLYQPQRETNLRTSLDEYLRFGLEAGIFFAS
jgi:hypothetical protein